MPLRSSQAEGDLSLTRWRFYGGLILPPIVATALVGLVDWVFQAERRCFASLDLATPGFICGFWAIMVFFVFAAVHLIAWLGPALWFGHRVRARGMRGWPAVTLTVVGVATVLAFAFGAVAASRDPNESGLNILQVIFPFLAGLFTALYFLGSHAEIVREAAT